MNDAAWDEGTLIEYHFRSCNCTIRKLFLLAAAKHFPRNKKPLSRAFVYKTLLCSAAVNVINDYIENYTHFILNVA